MKDLDTRYGKSSAVSTYLGLKYVTINPDTDTDSQFALPYAVNQFKVCVPEAVRAWQDSFESAIKKVIKDVASIYYVQDNVELDGIYNAVVDIIEKSAEAYAHIVDLWRRQNCAQVKDSENLDLGMIFLQGLSLHQAGQGIRILSTKKGAFTITNASWSKQILSNLKHFYLSEELRNVLEFLFGSTFKLQRDDATARFAILNPGLYENTSDVDPYTDYDTFVGYLDNMRNAIDGHFDDYPCLSEVLAQLGLNTYCSFNFTRDLAQQTLHVYEDKDGEIEAILYSAATGAIDYNNEIDISGLNGVVSIPTDVSNYYDGELHVERRILINVVSIMNFLRKAIDTDDLVAIQISYNHSQGAKSVAYFDLFQGHAAFTAAAAPTSAQLDTVLNNNLYNALLDSVGVAAITAINFINDQGEVSSLRSLRAGLSDFYLNPGDIEPIAAQASFNIVFAGSVNKDISDLRVNTTNVEATGNYKKDKNGNKTRNKGEGNDRKPNNNNKELPKEDQPKEERKDSVK